jgi:hypothetical protein
MWHQKRRYVLKKFKIANRVERNKNGRRGGWHIQSWVYCNYMILFHWKRKVFLRKRQVARRYLSHSKC